MINQYFKSKDYFSKDFYTLERLLFDSKYFLMRNQQKMADKESTSLIYVVFWISISCAMILFNKAVLDQVNIKFDDVKYYLCLYNN